MYDFSPLEICVGHVGHVGKRSFTVVIQSFGLPDIAEFAVRQGRAVGQALSPCRAVFRSMK